MTDRHDQNTEDSYPREIEGEPDPEPFDHDQVMRDGRATIESWRR